MEKELVKVGMKVIDKYGDVITIVRQHIAEPEKVDGVNKDGMYVVDIYTSSIEPYEEPNADNGTYSTSDPLEIAWLKRMCAENKEEREEAESNLREILNLPKEESTPYQVKDLEGNVIEEKVVEDKPELIKPTIQKLDDGGYVIDLDKLDKGTYTPNELLEIIYEALQVSENLPITQEFIESFGFVLSKKISTDSCLYTKEVSGGRVELYQSAHCYSIDLKKENNIMCIASRYKCATQSELRFLLTKGRIDCSK